MNARFLACVVKALVLVFASLHEEATVIEEVDGDIRFAEWQD